MYNYFANSGPEYKSGLLKPMLISGNPHKFMRLQRNAPLRVFQNVIDNAGDNCLIPAPFGLQQESAFLPDETGVGFSPVKVVIIVHLSLIHISEPTRPY